MVMIQCFTEHKTVMQALRNTKMFVTVQCFTESKTGAGFTEHNFFCDTLFYGTQKCLSRDRLQSFTEHKTVGKAGFTEHNNNNNVHSSSTL